ncbi:MAG: RsbRD N-terminal domain-containing protein [Planctomycetes bacterium]|jgi:hypothetical protein|nr:RsbRD N-terminal domain-containing protein [Planctomycetota bacterium]
MALVDLLRDRRERLLSGWRERIFAEYPGGPGFFAKERDGLKNPVGAMVRESTEGLLGGLIDGATEEETRARLDGIVRLRAVQDFRPAAALAFVFGLKSIVRGELDGVASPGEMREFEDAVDRLSLLAFEVYAGCREQMLRLSVKAMRDRSMKLMERAGMITGDPEEGEAR